MTTPRIEEYGEWDIEVDGVKYAGKRSLTQAHQAGIDEERERLLEIIGYLPYVSQEEYAKYKNGGVVKWVTLNDHFKALQDNK